MTVRRELILQPVYLCAKKGSTRVGHREARSLGTFQMAKLLLSFHSVVSVRAKSRHNSSNANTGVRRQFISNWHLDPRPTPALILHPTELNKASFWGDVLYLRGRSQRKHLIDSLWLNSIFVKKASSRLHSRRKCAIGSQKSVLFFNTASEASVSLVSDFVSSDKRVLCMTPMAMSTAWIVAQLEHIIELVELFAMIGREVFWPVLG